MIQNMLRIATLSLVAAAAVIAPYFAEAASSLPPVQIVKTVYTPEITHGDFDHWAVDMKRGHVFVSAEGHQSVEVLDLKTGDHIASISGVKLPHGLAFDPVKDQLMVEDGGDSALQIFAGEDFHKVERIQLIDGSATGKGDSPDSGIWDPQKRLFYIGNGGISAKLEVSTISIFSPDQNKIIGEIKVPTNNVESMALDNAHHHLFVNMRDHKEIGEFDLNSKQMIRTFTADGMNRNTSMAIDNKTGRLFVVGRDPAILYVFNTADGHLVTQAPCVNINDGATWDPASKRLYISGSEGLSIFHQNTPDQYTEILRIPTNGAKTHLLVPSMNKLFLAHPKTSIDISAIMMYKINK